MCKVAKLSAIFITSLIVGPLMAAEVTVTHDTVPVAKVGKLAAVTTVPPTSGRKPALLLAGWLSCDSVASTNESDGFVRFMKEVANRSGFVFMRVDKPGVGGSDGNCAETDFKTELEGYRAGWHQLAARSDVDTSRMFVLGISNGGGFAPLVPSDPPAAGYISIGGWSKTWFEHMIAFERTRLTLQGTPADKVNALMKAVGNNILDRPFHRRATVCKHRKHFSKRFNISLTRERFSVLRWHSLAQRVPPRCGSTRLRSLRTRRSGNAERHIRNKSFRPKSERFSRIRRSVWTSGFRQCGSLPTARTALALRTASRALGVTQKTAWFMLQRIRLAMQNGSISKMSGTCEADETYIGAKARYMHKNRRTGVGDAGIKKTPIQGMLERGKGDKLSRVVLKVVPNTRRPELCGNVREHVKAGSTVCTDALMSYDDLQRITTAKSSTTWNATLADKFTLTVLKTSGRC